MKNELPDSLPIATKWLLEKTNSIDHPSISNVFLISCSLTSMKGTGFLLSNGMIVTNEHVVRNCPLNQIVAYSTTGDLHSIKDSHLDESKDLAILIPETRIKGGLHLNSANELYIGEKVHTWGFPFDHNGPAPLFSEGSLSGYKSVNGQKRYVIGGAFNPGNSGGPLFRVNSDEVVGIVVAKQLFTLTPWHHSALNALKVNSSGVCFSAKDSQGNIQNFVESQLVAELLIYYRNQSQVMLGQAIVASELQDLLEKSPIS